MKAYPHKRTHGQNMKLVHTSTSQASIPLPFNVSNSNLNSFFSSLLSSCYAVNGIDFRTVTCVYTERPDAPTKANIVKVESRTITVSWSPPYSGNSPILYYIVELKEVTDEWDTHAKQQRIPGTETKAVVTGLWPGTAYHIRLIAENNIGRSEAGVALHAITELEGN